MRKKLLNNNLTDSIAKGGALYRPGELPTLTKEQIAQANLVSKLPKDFPFANWEGMNTKQQLQQMRYSGLNDQDQWSLLNSNVPLSVLDQHNQAQDEVETRASATRIATTLMNAVAQANVPRAQATDNKPTISTSLQNAVLKGQLERSIDALSENFKSASSSKDAFEQKSGTLSAKIGGEVSATARKSDQKSSPTPTPNPNQTTTPSTIPNETPLPEPGSLPESTPYVDRSPQNAGVNETAKPNTAYQNDPIEYLFGIDTTLLSEESRNRLYFISRKFYGDGVVPQELFMTYLNEIGKITAEMQSKQEDVKQEEEKGKYFATIKTAADLKATWGTEMIYNQHIYSSEEGTFGGAGNLNMNACGAVAIHNVNHILGLNTRYDDLLFALQSNSNLTTNLFGVLGMNPLIITANYEKAGMQVTFYDDLSKISKSHEAYIVLFGHPSGAHYVAASYDSDKDVFLVYNNFKKSKAEEWSTLTPSAYAASAFAQKQDNRSYGWFVWGIDKPKQPIVKKTGPTAGKAGRWLKMIK